MPDAAYHPMMRHLVRGLRRRCGVREGDALLVAVSGGADSVALLRGLHLLAPRRTWRLQLHVAHIHHGLRGHDAEDDARFVADLATRFDLPLHRRDVRLRDPDRNVEAQARHARYAALQGIAEEQGIRLVATAQHADDQLETLLLALLRGQSVERFKAMAPRRPITPKASVNLVRPLLTVTRDEIREFLTLLNQPHRQDASNTDVARTRNRLRRDVTPVLRELNPNVARAAVDLTDRLRRERP